MRIASLVRFAAAAITLAAAVPAAAQQHPSFAGTWVLVADASIGNPTVAPAGDARFRAGNMGTGWGSPLTITERPGRLIVEYPFFSAYDLQAPLRYEFPLDGSERENDVRIGPERTRLRAGASWDGTTLVIATRQPVPPEVAAPGVMAVVRRALSLAAPDSLVIVTTRVGVAGAPTNVVRATYARRR